MVCIVAILLDPVILPFPLFTEHHLLSYITIAAMAVMTVWSGVDYMKAYWPYITATK
jgi:phosphatidylglycerophosphate synthase